MNSQTRWFAKRGNVLRGGLASKGGLGRILANHRDWDIYWGINKDAAPPHAVKARNEEITTWCNILLDLDPITPQCNPHMAAETYLERAKGVLGDVVPRIVDTGRGVQLILELQPQLLGCSAERYRATAAVRALFALLCAPGPVHGCTLDTSCSDLARVARLPGSINQKTGRVCGVVTEGEQLSTAAMVRLTQLSQGYSEPLRVPNVGGSWKSHLHLLPQDVLRFISEGVTEPGRHRMAYKTAAYLKDLGTPELDALRLVGAASGKCRPHLAEFVRCVQNAYRKTRHD